MAVIRAWKIEGRTFGDHALSGIFVPMVSYRIICAIVFAIQVHIGARRRVPAGGFLERAPTTVITRFEFDD